MIEPLYTFAELLVLPLTAHVGIIAMTLLWMLVLRTAWRNNWIGLFLGAVSTEPKKGNG